MKFSEWLGLIGNEIRRLTKTTNKIKVSTIPQELQKIFNAERLLDGTIDYIHTDVETIRDYEFFRQKKLISIDMPNVKTVGEHAFNGCTNLKNINLRKINHFSTLALANCSSITNVELYGWMTLPYGCFFSCGSLQSVMLLQVQTIEAAAFNNCIKLDTIIIRTSNKVCTVADPTAFQNTPISKGTGTIVVPESYVEQYKKATNWATYYAKGTRIISLEEYENDTARTDNN